MSYYIQPLTASEAREILSWRYVPPYDFYNPPEANNPEELVTQFLDPVNGFHGVRDSHQQFVGFCSFGIDGQVPGGQYDLGPLDIGLGMKPAVTNQGHGQQFFEAIIHYARQTFDPPSLRLTVAEFNLRATRVYRRAGFAKVAEFRERVTGENHLIMEQRTSDESA